MLGARLEQASVQVDVEAHRREAVGRRLDRPAVGREPVRAGATRAGGAHVLVLGVLVLADPYAGGLAPRAVGGERVPAARPRAVQRRAREAVLCAAGGAGGEAGAERVALLDHGAVGVAAAPPGEQRRVLP